MSLKSVRECVNSDSARALRAAISYARANADDLTEALGAEQGEHEARAREQVLSSIGDFSEHNPRAFDQAAELFCRATGAWFPFHGAQERYDAELEALDRVNTRVEAPLFDLPCGVANELGVVMRDLLVNVLCKEMEERALKTRPCFLSGRTEWEWALNFRGEDGGIVELFLTQSYTRNGRPQWTLRAVSAPSPDDEEYHSAHCGAWNPQIARLEAHAPECELRKALEAYNALCDDVTAPALDTAPKEEARIKIENANCECEFECYCEPPLTVREAQFADPRDLLSGKTREWIECVVLHGGMGIPKVTQ